MRALEQKGQELDYPSGMTLPQSPEEPPKAESLTFSVGEAAAALGVSPATIYRLLSRRLLRPVSGLRHKRISKAQIHALVRGDDKRRD